MNKKKDKLIQARYDIICKYYYEYIFQKALQYAKNKSIAEDCTHTVIMKIAENPQYIQDIETESCKAYLYRSIVNTINTEMKRRNRDIYAGLNGELIYMEQTYQDDFTNLKGKHGFGEEMDEHFKSLNSKDVQVISMKYLDQMENSEIAVRTGEPENTVAQRIRRARVKLMNIIVDKDGVDDEK